MPGDLTRHRRRPSRSSPLPRPTPAPAHRHPHHGPLWRARGRSRMRRWRRVGGRRRIARAHRRDFASRRARRARLRQHFTTMYATHHARLHQLLGPADGGSARPERRGRDQLDARRDGPHHDRTAVSLHDRLAPRLRPPHGELVAERLDLLLTTADQPPPALGTFAPAPEDPTAAGMRAQQFASFTLPFNMTGQPAISSPCTGPPTACPSASSSSPPMDARTCCCRLVRSWSAPGGGRSGGREYAPEVQPQHAVLGRACAGGASCSTPKRIRAAAAPRTRTIRP